MLDFHKIFCLSKWRQILRREKCFLSLSNLSKKKPKFSCAKNAIVFFICEILLLKVKSLDRTERKRVRLVSASMLKCQVWKQVKGWKISSKQPIKGFLCCHCPTGIKYQNFHGVLIYRSMNLSVYLYKFFSLRDDLSSECLTITPFAADCFFTEGEVPPTFPVPVHILLQNVCNGKAWYCWIFWALSSSTTKAKEPFRCFWSRKSWQKDLNLILQFKAYLKSKNKLVHYASWCGIIEASVLGLISPLCYFVCEWVCVCK